MRYECHITTDYYADTRTLVEILDLYNFRRAKLTMNKSESTEDCFCTGHSNSYEAIKVRALLCASQLTERGFIVRRVKIEEVLLDSREGWDWKREVLP